MKNHELTPSRPEKPMTLKKTENDDDRKYWDSVSRDAQHWREHQPTWSRRVSETRDQQPSDRREQREHAACYDPTR